MGNGELMKMVIAKQAVDLHTNTFGQRIAAVYCHNYLEKHLVKILNFYKNKRRNVILLGGIHAKKNVNGHDPGRNVQLDNSSRIYGHKEMFTDTINSNVAYVIGSAFYIEEV